MGRYRLVESAEHGIQRVHGYRDLEIHHPSQHGHQPGRHYATVDGRREEVLKTPTSSGHLMVSKDFILTDEGGSTHVNVPSPAAGYIGKVDARNGLVCIYDHKGGELVAQVRHMELHGSDIHEGQTVAYGQPLGFQGGYGGGNAHAYGVHTHIDFNSGRLEDFKKYFGDIDRGAIAIGVIPPTQPHVQAPAQDAATDRRVRIADHEHGPGRHDESLRHAQSALAHLGYTGADGRLVQVDGEWGVNSRYAVRQFQAEHRLPATGLLDPHTRERLAAEDRTMASSTHPAHALYRQSLDAVRDLDRRMSIPSGQHSVALAGVAAAEAAQAGLKRVDRIELGKDGVHAQAVEFRQGVDFWATNHTSAPIKVAHAVTQPLATSSARAAHALASQTFANEPIARQQTSMRTPVL